MGDIIGSHATCFMYQFREEDGNTELGLYGGIPHQLIEMRADARGQRITHRAEIPFYFVMHLESEAEAGIRITRDRFEADYNELAEGVIDEEEFYTRMRGLVA